MRPPLPGTCVLTSLAKKAFVTTASRKAPRGYCRLNFIRFIETLPGSQSDGASCVDYINTPRPPAHRRHAGSGSCRAGVAVAGLFARDSETESLLALVDFSAAFETFEIFAGLQALVMAFRSGAPHASGGGGSRHSPSSSSEARAFIPRLPCAYFQSGTCSKGDRCPFSHDPSIPYKKSHCKHYAAGHCMSIALSSLWQLKASNMFIRHKRQRVHIYP